MFKAIKRLKSEQFGQALVMVALLLGVLAAFAALVIDVGDLYNTKAELQNAADAAALAGAQELPDNPSQAKIVAESYAGKNGLTTDSVAVTFGTGNKSISVKIDRTANTSFAKIFGVDTSPVSADATASVGIAASVPWIVPFVIPRPPAFNYEEIYVMRMYGAGPYPNGYSYPSDYTSDSVYGNYPLEDTYSTTTKEVYTTNKNVDLKQTASSNSSTLITIPINTEVTFLSSQKVGSTTWYKISYTKNNSEYSGFVNKNNIDKKTVDTTSLIKAKNIYPYQFDYMNVYIEKNTNFNNYINWLKNGYHETFSINQNMYYYAPSSGGRESVDAFANRVTRDNNTDYTKAKIGDARVILIPVVESMLSRNTNTSGNVSIKIIGFVGFFIQEVHKNTYGTSFWFEGRFLEDLQVGSGEVTFDTDADFGLRVLKLTE
ncbi:pilus assembly protein TadG-related protein [Trichococcus sp.]|uniref:pilus assembly protein TadG-related protein n=1 Tax=Trichococcus sp. TaxID=1985464 RepID=UPI003C7C16AD